MCITENGTGEAGPYTLDEDAYTRCTPCGTVHNRGRGGGGEGGSEDGNNNLLIRVASW